MAGTGKALQRRRVLQGALAVGLAMTGGGRVRAALPQGFAVPAEESRHQRTFLQWPCSPKVYRRQADMAYAQETIANLASTIAEFEPAVLLADKDQHGLIRGQVSAKVELWDIPTEDLWCRDSGPLFAKGPDGLVVSDLKFNGWGGKQVHDRDGQIARRVAERLGLPVVESGLHGEAGGVEQDGHGLLLAHESSWVNPNRNPGSRNEIEALLLAAYGAEKIIWAPGIAGADITDYHIDALARLTGPGRVLIQLGAPDPEDPWSVAAHETYAILQSATGVDGRPLDITVIPDAVDIRSAAPDFVNAYANYYVCNGAVICAEFGDRNSDAAAQEALARAYPGRQVVALNVDALGELGGGIHCATREMPA